ncbi:MAG: YggS family pyridoxal phosphate-dependent enzyme [Bacteroidota bacterium]
MQVMAIDKEAYKKILLELGENTTLVAVSKTKPVEDILELYHLGQRDFGENYTQELVEKQARLPADIRWHFIGHLQSNKVKQILPFIYLVQGVDSLRLLQEINKQAAKINKTAAVLLQVHIAREETKFGLDEKELEDIFSENQLATLQHVSIAGLMGLASFTDNADLLKKEFGHLKSLFDQYARHPRSRSPFRFLSMGMSSDYTVALANGSNMVRIGSRLFGKRDRH